MVLVSLSRIRPALSSEVSCRPEAEHRCALRSHPAGTSRTHKQAQAAGASRAGGDPGGWSVPHRLRTARPRKARREGQQGLPRICFKSSKRTHKFILVLACTMLANSAVKIVHGSAFSGAVSKFRQSSFSARENRNMRYVLRQIEPTEFRRAKVRGNAPGLAESRRIAEQRLAPRLFG